MRQVTILRYCDACWADGEQRTPATQSFVVAILPGEAASQLVHTARVIESCDLHAKAIEDARLLAGEYGAQLDPLPASGRAPSTTRALPHRLACPVCGDDFVRSYLVKHLHDVHIGHRQPSPTSCPDCGFRSERAAAVARHRASAHSWDPIAEALALYHAHRPSRA